MAIQEIGANRILHPKSYRETVQQSARRVMRDSLKVAWEKPHFVANGLIHAQKRYVDFSNEEPASTRAYSPLRAAASYVEFECHQPLLHAWAVSSGKDSKYVKDICTGIAIVARALISAEDAIARGVHRQALYELNFEKREIPLDDRDLYVDKHYKGRSELLQYRVDSLMSDPSGTNLVWEEYHDMAESFKYQEANEGVAKVWSRGNMQGAGYARDMYIEVYDIAQPIFHEVVLEESVLAKVG